MFDTTIEAPITLTEAADMLPRRRGKRKVHTATLYRWTKTGCRGVSLEYVQVGGTRCTSREALNRFYAKLTAASGAPISIGNLSASRLRKNAERAGRALEAAGA